MGFAHFRGVFMSCFVTLMETKLSFSIMNGKHTTRKSNTTLLCSLRKLLEAFSNMDLSVMETREGERWQTNV